MIKKIFNGKNTLIFAPLSVFLAIVGYFGYVSIQAHAQLAPTVSSIQTQLTTATTNLAAASTTVANLQTQLDNSAATLLDAAVNQAISSSGVSVSTLASVTNLSDKVIDSMVTNAVTQAVSSGNIALNQLASGNAMVQSEAQKLITTAVNDAVASGSANLSQMTGISRASSTEVINLVTAAVNAGVLNGGILLTQVANVNTLFNTQIQNVAAAAIADVEASGIILSTAQRTQIIANSITAAQALTGAVDLNTMKNTIATQISIATGGTPIATIVGAMGGNVQNTFTMIVRDQLITDLAAQLNVMSSPLTVNILNNMVANTTISMTGLGNISTITSAIGTASLPQFTQMVQNQIISGALSQIQGITGPINLANIQNTIASNIVGATGLGSVSGITSSFTAITSGAFTGAVQNSIITQASAALNSFTGAAGVAQLQNLISTNIIGSIGVGSAATLAATLTSINPASLTTAITNSIVQNSVLGLSGVTLPPTAAQVESLIASNIMGITGTGNLTSISAAINDALAGSLAEVGVLMGQLDGAMASIATAFSDVSILTSGLSSLSTLSSLSLANISSLTSSITSYASGVLGSAVGSLSTSITGVTTEITSLTSMASLASLTSIDTAGLTSAIGGTATGLSGIASGASGIVTNSNTMSTDVVSSYSGNSGSSGASMGNPFGGLSTYVFYCTCSANIAVYFNDLAVPSGAYLPLIFQPGATTLYSYYMIYSPGVWILGLWQAGGSCMYYVGTSCSSLPTSGTMTMVGTSM